MVDYYYKSFYMLFKISGIAIDFTKNGLSYDRLPHRDQERSHTRVYFSSRSCCAGLLSRFFLLNDSSILKTCVKSSPAD